MPRFKLTIEYDGRFFCGWQRQPNALSVQQAIEDAAFSFCQQRVSVYGAGRTDAGVHALGQVAHLDLKGAYPAYRIMDALNFYLHRHPITILAVEEVGEAFHARFSALSRHYVYRIMNRRAPLALDNGRAWHIIKPLDVEAMREAAQLFVGLHDFNAFRSLHCQATSSLRYLDAFQVEKKESLIELKVQSRSFLHNQVRIMVGSLALIGHHKWMQKDVLHALSVAKREVAGPTAPPDGLYFSHITYPQPESGEDKLPY